MKTHLLHNSVFMLALICLLSGYCNGVDNISLIEQQIKGLVANKCDASRNKNIGVYKTDYRNLVFCKKPLIFPSDVIPALPVKGDLFKYAADKSYKELKERESNRALEDLPRYVNDTFLRLLRDNNTYLLFSSAMYLYQDMSQYKLFASEIESRQRDYKEYNRLKNDSFMGSKVDFDKQLLKYNPRVFEEGKNRISQFATAYNKKSTDFIRQILIPLVASDEYITGEVSSYLNGYNYGDLSEFGIKRDELISLLSKDVPTREQARIIAGKLNRSVFDVLADISSPNHSTLYFISLTYSNNNDLLERTFSPLSLFEVFSFSYYEKRIKNGKWISNDEFIERDTNAILSAALNRNIYRIADRLMEFEKPFYCGMFGPVPGLTDNLMEIALSDTGYAGLISAKASFNLYNCGSYKIQSKVYENNAQKKVLENAAVLSKIAYTVLDISVDIPLLKFFTYSAKAGKSLKETKAIKASLIESVNDANKIPYSHSLEGVANTAASRKIAISEGILDNISPADATVIKKYFGIDNIKTSDRVLFSTPQMKSVLSVAAKDASQKQILVNRIKELGEKYSGLSSNAWGGSGGFLKLEYIGLKLPSDKINPDNIVAVIEVGKAHKDYAAITAKLNSFAKNNPSDFVSVKGANLSVKPRSDRDMAKLYDYFLGCTKSANGKCRFIKTGEGGVFANADNSILIRVSSHEMRNPHFHIYNKLESDLYVNYSVDIKLPGFALNKGKEFMLTKPLRVMQYNHLLF